LDARVLGLANRLGARTPTPRPEPPGPWLHTHAPLLQTLQDASHQGGGEPSGLPVAAGSPACPYPSAGPDGEAPEPARPTPPTKGAGGADGEGGNDPPDWPERSRVETPLPAIEGLAADPEVPAGQSGLAPVLAVIIHPLQPAPGGPLNSRPPRSRYLERGNLPETIRIATLYQECRQSF
jgi:hypothetical protein